MNLSLVPKSVDPAASINRVARIFEVTPRGHRHVVSSTVIKNIVRMVPEGILWKEQPVNFKEDTVERLEQCMYFMRIAESPIRQIPVLL